MFKRLLLASVLVLPTATTIVLGGIHYPQEIVCTGQIFKRGVSFGDVDKDIRRCANQLVIFRPTQHVVAKPPFDPGTWKPAQPTKNTPPLPNGFKETCKWDKSGYPVLKANCTVEQPKNIPPFIQKDMIRTGQLPPNSVCWQNENDPCEDENGYVTNPAVLEQLNRKN
jgi:hypothetical protein